MLAGSKPSISASGPAGLLPHNTTQSCGFIYLFILCECLFSFFALYICKEKGGEPAARSGSLAGATRDPGVPR